MVMDIGLVNRRYCPGLGRGYSGICLCAALPRSLGKMSGFGFNFRPLDFLPLKAISCFRQSENPQVRLNRLAFRALHQTHRPKLS